MPADSHRYRTTPAARTRAAGRLSSIRPPIRTAPHRTAQGAYPHLRSLFSTSVEQAAQGQLFAFMSAMETLMTAVTPLVLNTVSAGCAAVVLGRGGRGRPGVDRHP